MCRFEFVGDIKAVGSIVITNTYYLTVFVLSVEDPYSLWLDTATFFLVREDLLYMFILHLFLYIRFVGVESPLGQVRGEPGLLSRPLLHPSQDPLGLLQHR